MRRGCQGGLQVFISGAAPVRCSFIFRHREHTHTSVTSHTDRWCQTYTWRWSWGIASVKKGCWAASPTVCAALLHLNLHRCPLNVTVKRLKITFLCFKVNKALPELCCGRLLWAWPPVSAFKGQRSSQQYPLLVEYSNNTTTPAVVSASKTAEKL